MAGYRMHPSILREYDIRGVVGETLTTDDALALGRAFGSFVAARGGRTVALGEDGRVSSPALASRFAEGLSATGMAVFRIGLGPTPMLYYAGKSLGADGAVMVTGSHNPPDQNGFKMVVKGAAIYGDDIRKLGEIAQAGAFASGAGRVVERPVMEAYLDRLLHDVDVGRPLTIAWDAGNGATGALLDKLCANLPGRHIVLNGAVDGTFPAHHPDPTVPETLEELRKVVLSERCDFGVAFDGDGDRIGIVDNEGEILWGDQIMVFLAEDVLSVNPGATIIADVKASQVLFDEISRMGGTPLMWRTGHSLIKAKMAETKALLAGEMSGHIFFADRYYGYDDALYAGIRFMNVVSRATGTLAELRGRLPKMINTPELRFPCPDERKFAVVAEVKRRLETARAEMNTIDGVRVKTADGWWLLRASNTQDVLVARCEAASPTGLESLKAALAEQLSLSGISAPVLRPSPEPSRRPRRRATG
ncbi:MAG TPA: phosphomannomutase/phosphoglucomutase [Alphaproteobacteria bacterium]|nr:phosphomannomutase/phosphoglucomutase [Alphaproteobacteria bacterium]